MQCPILIVIARNTSISASVTSGWREVHFGLSHFRLEGRPLVMSVKVVMVVPVSLCHQQCYNFHKKQLENSKWTGAGLYTWGFTVSYPPGAPCKGVNYTYLRARGRCPLLI